MRLEVRINGTDKNPFEQMGLKQNPFPQIARADLLPAMMELNRCGCEKGYSSEPRKGVK